MNKIDQIIKQNDEIGKLLNGKVINLRNKSISILCDIQKLNSELILREKNYEKNILSEKKINDILNNNQKLVKLNVGGKYFVTSLNTLSSRRGTMFYKQILRGEFKKLDVIPFYDREPTYFPIILNFLRTGKVNLNLLSNEQKEDLLQECIFYEISYIIEILKNTADFNYEIVEVKIANPYKFNSKMVGDFMVKTLVSKKQDKGFCSESGYIYIKLNKEMIASSIIIAGYNGDSLNWFVNNGAGAYVYITDENNLETCTWEFVGQVCTEYGINQIEIPLKGKKKIRCIQFMSDSLFGIGYLNFK